MPAVGQCAICFSTLLSSETFAIKNCGHTFHQRCIKQWIKTGKNCSSCRVKCTERDVIKLYIQEANLDDTFSQQNNSEAKVLEMESKLEKANRKLQKLTAEKEDAEVENHSLRLQIKDKDNKLKAMPGLQLRVQNMHALEDEMAALQRQLKAAEVKLNASEFYDFLSKSGKGPDAHDKFVDRNGDIIVASFEKMLRKERDGLKKRLDETTAELKALQKTYNKERAKSLERKELCKELRAQIVDLKEKNGNIRDAPKINPKLRDILNCSPEQKRPRPSLGFSFESPVFTRDILDSAINEKRVRKRIVDPDEDDENDAEYKPPSPPKKAKAFTFESESDYDSDWRPSSAPSTSIMSVPTPVQRFTRNTSSSKNLGSKFGTTLTDKRPTAITLKKATSTQQVKTRSMDKYVQKSSRSSRDDADDSVVCLD